METQTIECKERVIVKIFKTLILLTGLTILLILNFSVFDKTPTINLFAVLLWPVWIFTFIIYVVGSPDLIITNEGLEVNILWKTFSIVWEDVVLVREDVFQSWIYVRHLTLFNYVIGLGGFFLRPGIQVG